MEAENADLARARQIAGAALRAARETMGVKTARLAKITGMSQRMVNAWETGFRPIGEAQVVVLARELGMPAERLRFTTYLRQGDQPPGETSEAGGVPMAGIDDALRAWQMAEKMLAELQEMRLNDRLRIDNDRRRIELVEGPMAKAQADLAAAQRAATERAVGVASSAPTPPSSAGPGGVAGPQRDGGNPDPTDKEAVST